MTAPDVPARDPLAARAEGDGSAVAVRAGDTEVTWAQLSEQAAVVAGCLVAAGVEPGRRVATVFAPGPDAVIAIAGILRAGASVVPLWGRTPPDQLAAQLRETDPVLILAGGATLPTVTAAVERVADGPHVFTLDGSDRPLSAVGGEPRGERAIDPAAEVCVISTSGSTGRPKAVRLTFANHLASAAGCAESLGAFGPGDTWILPLGLHRVGGFAALFRCLVSGMTLEVFPRFDVEAVLAAASRRSGARLSVVPTMVRDLVGRGGAEPLRNLRAVMLGGAPAAADEVRAWAEAGIPVCPSYGMSESCSQIATVPPGAALDLLGTVGRPHSQVVVAALGEDDELWLRGPVVSPGYVDDDVAPGGFAEVDGTRWYRTGDRGFVRDDGALVVTGRRDLLIITGGEKVQPEPVEAVLLAHPGVDDVLVRGEPDARFGEIVTALVVGTAGETELRDWCRARVAPYMVPRRYDFVARIPRSEDGKVLRAAAAAPPEGAPPSR